MLCFLQNVFRACLLIQLFPISLSLDCELHEGSGLASCVSDVKKAFPKANVTKGFSIYGHEVRSGKLKVEKWINGLK